MISTFSHVIPEIVTVAVKTIPLIHTVYNVISSQTKFIILIYQKGMRAITRRMATEYQVT